MGNKTSITGFIGTFYTKSDGNNPGTSMSETGGTLADGQVYLDLRANQADSVGNHGGSLMWYNSNKSAWFGVLGTTSTSTTTSSSTSTSSSTTTSTTTT